MRRALCGAVLGLAVVLGGCGAKKGEGGGATAGGGKGGRQGTVFTVELVPVELRKVDYVVAAPGTIEAFERVQVTARVAGAVDRVAFTEGQTVAKGALLVSIDAGRYSVAVASAHAAVEKALASQHDLEASVARREGASEKNPGLIPGEELESFRTKVLTAKADVRVAQEALHKTELDLRDSSVRAPIEGVIQTRTVETGQYVQAGYVMATLLRADPMLLRFPVEPSEAPRLKAGMPVSFTLRETQRTFVAKITLVSGAADATTHMVGVTAEIDGGDHRYWLRPGSFADVTVEIGAARAAPVIPRSAARATDHGYVAYVADGDVARERVLKLGMSTKDGLVEVRSGLEGGERLVVRGAEALADGVKVREGKVESATVVVRTEGAASAAPAGSSDEAPRAGKRGRRGAGGAPGEAPAASTAAP